MARHRERRIQNENGEYIYRCSKCDNYLSKEEMVKDISAKYQIGYHCKVCSNAYEKEKRVKQQLKDKEMKNTYEYKIQDTSYLNLTGVVDSDYDEVKVFLSKIGYNPDKPIYPQFKKRIEDKYGIILND